MGTITKNTARGLILRALGLAMIASLAGCGWIQRTFSPAPPPPEIFVPEHETAREQYDFAHDKHMQTIDFSRRKDVLDRLVAGYERVIELFPEDQQFTPLAKLEICELYYKYKQFGSALQMAQHIASNYQAIPYIDAKARYVTGLCQEKLGQRMAAQATYKECLDRHEKSTDPLVRNVVQVCRNLYNRVVTPNYQ